MTILDDDDGGGDGGEEGHDGDDVEWRTTMSATTEWRMTISATTEGRTMTVTITEGRMTAGRSKGPSKRTGGRTTAINRFRLV